MTGKIGKVFSLCFLLAFSFCISSLLSQETPDYGKILGAWDVEVNAEGEFYYLSMDIEKTNGELKGAISEQAGSFTDTPLSEIKFDGQTLSFEFTGPTPPDGIERLIKTEFTVGDNKLEGSVTIEDLGITATATATRKEK